MTSRISFFKLQKEDMRHRLSVILLTAFYFLLEIMTLVIQIQNVMSFSGWERQDVYNAIIYVTAPNTLVMVLTLCLALTMAANGFAYLHSSTKIDMYHALPVKRKKIFWSVFCNALLIFTVLRIVASIIETVVIIALGYMDGPMLCGILSSIVCYFVIFAGGYLTVALAMIMTGNTAVGMLGTAVFFTYFPLVIRYLLDALGQTFFKTYVSYVSTSKVSPFDYASPASLAWILTRNYTNGSWTWSRHKIAFWALLLWIVALVILCQTLFDRRPSEAAGRSMAFPKINPVIRILLVIPAAIYTGIFLYSVTLSSSRWWMLPGIVAGCVLFHGIIESIFQSDIHGLWSHKKQMMATLMVCLGIVASFWFDIYGFDSYVPQEDKVETITMQDIYYNNRAYMFWGEEQEGISGEEKDRMIALLQDAIAETDKNDFDTDDTDTFTVVYRMKNGRKKQRAYSFSTEMEDRVTECLYQSETYKKSLYSLYTCDWDQITSVHWDITVDVSELKLTQDEKQEFFSTYLEELDALTYDEIKETLPIGKIAINHRDDQNNVEEYYAVYPSFQRALAFLKEKGCSVERVLADSLSVTSIEIYDNATGQTWTVTDADTIAAVADKLFVSGSYYGVACDYFYENENEGSDIVIFYRTAYGESETSVVTDAETFQILKDAADEE